MHSIIELHILYYVKIMNDLMPSILVHSTLIIMIYSIHFPTKS